MDYKTIAVRGWKTGIILAATVNAAIMLASDKELNAPWAAINDVCHAIDGDEKEQPVGYSPRESLLGMALTGAAMFSWSALYEGALAVTKARSGLISGALGAAVAYGVDYHLVPKRFTPGIERRLSQRAVWVVYGILGVTLACSRVWNKEKTPELS